MASYTAKSREADRAPLPIDSRKDTWWIAPLYTFLVLSAFGVYTTFRAFENRFFETGVHDNLLSNYLSPFYSPLIPLKLHIAGWTVSPAFYILIFPLAFRMTCYYYRKAYYRAFFWDPPACAVAEPRADARMSYTGERQFPYVLQNLHRYAFYAAVIIILILWYDTFMAFTFRDTPGGPLHFGIGVGSIIFLINVILLSAYTFGCHSWRHLVGGKHNCYSCSCMARTSYGVWKKVSFLNSRHALYAWCSLYSVALADLYVRLVASGAITDFRIL